MSARRWIGAFEPWASSTSRTIWASAVSRPTLVASKTKLPVLRERYAAEQLVERWQLRDLRLNSGLTDSVFR